VPVDAGAAQLLGNDEAMLFVADNDRIGEPKIPRDAARCLLEETSVARQCGKLLRKERARYRPQPRPAAAGEDHRTQ
jgi:hypothetical protein